METSGYSWPIREAWGADFSVCYREIVNVASGLSGRSVFLGDK
jgi:hypothetical protein